MERLKYAVSITDEAVGVNTPIMLHGSFEECFRTAAECGYDGVELQIKDPAARSISQLKQLMRDYRLAVPAITTGSEYFGNGLSLIDEDPAGQQRAIDRLGQHIDLAAELGSMVLLGSMRGVITDLSLYGEIMERLVRNVKKVQEKAEASGADVVFEPINLYVINYINSMDEGADFVKKVASPRFWLMADTHHMRIHDGDMYESLMRHKDLIRYVHYSDGNRYYPGGGNIDFLACTKALLDMGYSGWVTMECLALTDGKLCAKRALDYSRHLEEACRAVMDGGTGA